MSSIKLSKLLFFLILFILSSSLSGINIAPNATITTTVTTWHSGTTQENIAKIIDGITTNDFDSHPTDANDKTIKFKYNNTFNKGSFVFYNRINTSQAAQDRIVGSIVNFKHNGNVTETFTFTSSSNIITFTPQYKYTI